jgi:hypothetical protein
MYIQCSQYSTIPRLVRTRGLVKKTTNLDSNHSAQNRTYCDEDKKHATKYRN